jgi:uncharacterized protein (TIGR02231 family)
MVVPILPPVTDDDEEQQIDPEEIGDDTLSADQKHEISLKDCPIVQVTVFQSNRALVTRQVKLNMKVEGEQIVLLNDLCSVAIDNSIRVSGVGHATIQDVTVKSKKNTVKHDQTNAQKLRDEIKNIDEELKKLDAATTRLSKERRFLQSYSSSVVQTSKRDHDVGKLLDPKTLLTMTEYTQFISRETERIETSEVDITKQQKDLNKKRSELSEQLSKEKPAVVTTHVKYVELSLGASQPGEVVLQFNYMVNSAWWTPLYDIRVTSREDVFELTYYGNITQNTKEDWTDANVNLSTADPTDRSAPPTLTTLNLYTQYKNYNQSIQTSYSRRAENMYDEEDDSGSDEEFGGERLELKKSADMLGGLSKPSKSKVVSQTSTAQRGATSTVFHIPRAATIPSDNAPHKVTIATLRLKSTSSHYTVPKLDANAFVKVKAVNDSEFPLLVGKTSVFVDNNFVATGMMNNVNPMEEFESFLGQDPSVKIEYKPPSKFRETQGLLKGTSAVRMERRTVVKNNKEIPIELIITDQIPKSEDDKIKVKMTYPEFPPLTSQQQQNGEKQQIENLDLVGTQDQSIKAKKATLSDQNIVEWTIPVPPKKEIIVSIKYTVSWPTGSAINDDHL